MLTDIQLITDTINGDQSAFGKLMSRYQNHMYSVCYNILKTKPEAQEAVQDTFIKAYKSLNSYKEEAKFSSWLYKIAYRTSLDMIRKRKKTVDMEAVSFGITDTGSGIVSKMETVEKNTNIREAIAQLSPKEAGLIHMFYLEEMSVKELSKASGISHSNVKVILFRARKNLAAIIKRQYSDLEII